MALILFLTALLIVTTALLSTTDALQIQTPRTFMPATVAEANFWKAQLHLDNYEPMASTDIQSTGTRDLPPLIQRMADERREFELNLGKAMDVLRKDYPNMLHTVPDMSIYHQDLKVVDPSGVRLTGIKNYRSSFRFFQTFVSLFYNTQISTVQSRMVYDFARSAIRISWHATLVPKVVGNRRNAVYVDGISMYYVDRTNGDIIEHRVEQLLINNTPVTPPYGIFSAMMQDFAGPEMVPVGVGAGVGV